MYTSSDDFCSECFMICQSFYRFLGELYGVHVSTDLVSSLYSILTNSFASDISLLHKLLSFRLVLKYPEKPCLIADFNFSSGISMQVILFLKSSASGFILKQLECFSVLIPVRIEPCWRSFPFFLAWALPTNFFRLMVSSLNDGSWKQTGLCLLFVFDLFISGFNPKVLKPCMIALLIILYDSIIDLGIISLSQIKVQVSSFSWSTAFPPVILLTISTRFSVQYSRSISFRF